MIFPLTNYNHRIPQGEELGAFGVKRKFDVHTGVDLYCNEGDEVLAIEAGEIIAIEWFTGIPVDMPWWNDTHALAIKGEIGIINYGEIRPNRYLKVGDLVEEGTVLGWVVPVLKKDKGKVPSMNMLHLELYSEYDGEWALWELDKPKPNNLLDPTYLLLSACELNYVQILERYMTDYVEFNLSHKCVMLLKKYLDRISKSKGSQFNHQAWDGGYVQHVVETIEIAIAMYQTLTKKRQVDFTLSDAIFILFIHDLEKPFKYVEPKQMILRNEAHGFIIKILGEFDIQLTDSHLNDLKYIHGEGNDYSFDERVQQPMAAFVHVCDVISARIWFDYPKN